MGVNRDWIELLSALLSANVDFLVVGAHAVAHYTEPRYTKDLDVWVRLTEDNIERLIKALRTFKAPLSGLTAKDLLRPTMIYQIGVEPNRVDILMGIDGLEFDAAWKNRVQISYGDIHLAILSKADLIRAKLATSRPQDLLDLKRLGAAAKRKSTKRRDPKRKS